MHDRVHRHEQLIARLSLSISYPRVRLMGDQIRETKRRSTPTSTFAQRRPIQSVFRM